MRILLVTVPGTLSGPLRTKLETAHEVVDFDGDPRDLETSRSHADADVIVHGLPDGVDDRDLLDHASSATWNLLTTTRASRYVFLSSMRIFDSYGEGWHVTERWAARPTTDPVQLAPYLAEVASREITRVRPVECRVLRLDDVVDGEAWATGPVAPTSLHIDDAVTAIHRATTADAITSDDDRWNALNIVRGDTASRYPLGEAAREPFVFAPAFTGGERTSSPEPVMPPVPGPVTGLADPERIVILGAGGPLGAVTARFLEDDHHLRLSGRRPLEQNAAADPQSEGAPLPVPPEPPHEEQVADVTDYDAVLAASRDMDTIINCTVLRHDPAQAFLVNTIGAWNVMRAAVELGIRRVVHTGPVLTLGSHPAGYNDDRDVASDVPPRPGDNLYFVSKLLGQEIVRIFAETHRILCPTLLFCGFVDPEVAARKPNPPGWFTISWDDSGRSMAAATRLTEMRQPFEIVHVMADSPHDRFRNDAIRTVLGWEPQDRLDHLWYRR